MCFLGVHYEESKNAHLRDKILQYSHYVNLLLLHRLCELTAGKA